MQSLKCYVVDILCILLKYISMIEKKMKGLKISKNQ